MRIKSTRALADASAAARATVFVALRLPSLIVIFAAVIVTVFAPIL